MDPNTNQANREGCFTNCDGRDAGYFAYNKQTQACACYLRSENCAKASQFPDYNFYEILDEGKNINFNWD